MNALNSLRRLGISVGTITPFLLLLAHAAPLSAQCLAPYLVEWPASNPVWKLCWIPPDASSGPDGSGLELRHVFYKGKRVLWRANMPVLNVLYDDAGGSCGPTYRDWFNELQAFEANNVVSPGYAEPTTPPRTVCDHPGSDAGTFRGVAVEKLSDRVVLTTQTRAGWYRYIQRISFWQDGTIEPEVGFTAVQHTCVNRAHNHHGYWRFDFDIHGFPDDAIRERKRLLFFSWWSTYARERARLRNASGSRRWRVVDKSNGLGVEILPGAHDSVGGDPFGGADVWALHYRGQEADDGGSTGGPVGDAQHIDPFVNGEGIDGRDVVLWYRIGHRHEQALDCEFVGPRLKLIGSW
jgi:hypothetical protein